MLSQEDNRRIADAVAAAEAKTTGEIRCVVAKSVSSYAEVPLGWGAAAALIAPPVAMFLGLHPLAVTGAAGEWTAGHVAALDSVLAGVLGAYALAQAVIFAVVAGIVSLHPIRRLLTPGTLKRRRVHRAAFAQYLATGWNSAPDETGVVIFVCLDDRQVEVVADAAIHKAVGDSVWNDAVRAVQEGMKKGDADSGLVRAVEICGAALAKHYPSTGPKPNKTPDAPVEL